MKSTLAVLFLMVVVLVGGYILSKLLHDAFLLNEQVTCEKLERQAEEFGKVRRDLFYITKTEDEMCRAHNIIINAPVK